MNLVYLDPKNLDFLDFDLTLHYHSFANFKYFFDRVEDSERTRSIFSESSTRSKKYSDLAKLCYGKEESIFEIWNIIQVLLVSTVYCDIYFFGAEGAEKSPKYMKAVISKTLLHFPNFGIFGIPLV